MQISQASSHRVGFDFFVQRMRAYTHMSFEMYVWIAIYGGILGLIFTTTPAFSVFGVTASLLSTAFFSNVLAKVSLRHVRHF